MEKATVQMIKPRGKRKKPKLVDLFLSFSNTQVINDHVAATDNITTQLRPCVSVTIPLWWPTSRIKQPRELFSRAGRGCVS